MPSHPVISLLYVYLLANHTSYRSMVGALQSHTINDHGIVYVVSQFIHSPCNSHCVCMLLGIFSDDRTILALMLFFLTAKKSLSIDTL